jgi:hypothetical protein
MGNDEHTDAGIMKKNHIFARNVEGQSWKKTLGISVLMTCIKETKNGDRLD